ncbi:hypothetical protein PsorP6_003605 [Peronosclerospora sorghi]|uniref:Uncharacterized protein n=1 Tax=Peronosclerospora sorghi TaxID=230839 RepID=A0ACC0VQU2_9STRA|nr:hypothetical protein PsorP6_003605 [Peronosclerospora sorghi]
MHTGTRATGDGGKYARLTPYTKAKPQRRKRAKDELDYLRRKVKQVTERQKEETKRIKQWSRI